MGRNKFIEDCVINIVADDYESFDYIWRQARKLALTRNLMLTKAQIVDALKHSISEGYVGVWELSPRAPARQVPYSAGRLHHLWFYVTKVGKKHVKELPESYFDP